MSRNANSTPQSNASWKGWPTPAKQKLLERLRQKTAGIPLWKPLPGPQTIAYQTPADVTGYGGAAGGGKTDPAFGLGLTAPPQSLILRRQAGPLRALDNRAPRIPGRTRRVHQHPGDAARR